MSDTNHYHQALPRPYSDPKFERDLSNCTAWVPKRDKDLIRHVCPKRGILNQLVQNLFASIVTNLRDQNITYYSPQNEQYLIRVILRGCTAIESTQQTVAGYDDRGTPGARPAVARSEQQQSITEKDALQREVGSEAESGEGTAGESPGEQVSKHGTVRKHCCPHILPATAFCPICDKV